MVDRREEIIFDKLNGDSDGWETRYSFNDVKLAMDEYMKETCLQLLEYMAMNNVNCTWYENEVGNIVHSFHRKGDCISKETLFENFL